MRLAGIELDRVVDLRAGRPRGLKTHADLDAFHRLHGHHGLGQAAVELLVPLGMRAESVGQALDANLDDAAQRVAGLLAVIDQFGDLVVAIGIEGVHDAAVAPRALFFERARLGRNRQFADLTT